MTDQTPQRPQKPPMKVLGVAALVVVGLGLGGAYSLRNVIEANTTSSPDGTYEVGDCRVFEREVDMGTHVKYRRAKMCKQEDGSWQIVEQQNHKPDTDNTEQIEKMLDERARQQDAAGQ